MSMNSSWAGTTYLSFLRSQLKCRRHASIIPGGHSSIACVSIDTIAHSTKKAALNPAKSYAALSVARRRVSHVWAGFNRQFHFQPRACQGSAHSLPSHTMHRLYPWTASRYLPWQPPLSNPQSGFRQCWVYQSPWQASLVFPGPLVRAPCSPLPQHLVLRFTGFLSHLARNTASAHSRQTWICPYGSS